MPRRWTAAILVALAATALGAPGGAPPADEAVSLSPYKSRIGANQRPRYRRHAGVDFAGRIGTPVLAAADGLVSRVIDAPLGCGTGVILAHPEWSRYTAYCHMGAVDVRAGQSVARGQ